MLILGIFFSFKLKRNFQITGGFYENAQHDGGKPVKAHFYYRNAAYGG